MDQPLVESDTLVIGASAAGLATAACLARRGVDYVLVEADHKVGRAWRNHYDRLHLHTSKGLSNLPYLKFPSSAPRYPSRAEVVAYLDDYVARLKVGPRFGQRVVSLARDGAGWLARSDDTRYRARHVVVATGFTRAPHRPSWPGLDGFAGPVLHSSEYHNGAAWQGQRVLVVGFGNSGGEIAIDLCEHGARPILSVRGAVNIVPRDFLGLPILAWGIALSLLPVRLADAIARLVSWLTVGPLDRLGLRKLPYGPMTQIRRTGHIPLLDLGTVARIRAREIEVLPGVEKFGARRVTFVGGAEREIDAVVLATGYRPALAEFLAPAAEVLDADGVPSASGVETLPGLYFCGFYVAPSGMLREIGREARRIANAVAARGKTAADLS
jgi:thioredoxin reductase